MLVLGFLIIIMSSNDRFSYLKPNFNFPEIKLNNRVYSPIQLDRPAQSFSKSFSPKTSYNKSFSPSPSPEKSLKSTARNILSSSGNFLPGFSSGSSFLSPNVTGGFEKLTSRSKNLSRVTDEITSQASNYGRKISPIQLNVPTRVSPKNFDDIAQRPIGTKVSGSNTEWIANREKEKLAEKFNKGEYIPSTSQMQMYGRKDPVSLFEKKELWKGSS